MDNVDLTRDLTLMLLYLTAWNEKIGTIGQAVRSWRSYDWDALDTLREQELISGNRKAKSIYLTEAGIAEAERLLSAVTFEQAATAEPAAKSSNKSKAKADDAESKSKTGSNKAFKFELRLDFETLECWRTVVVPADCSFLDLHIVIQEVFNWLDYHMFDFKLKYKGENVQIDVPSMNTLDSMFTFFRGSGGPSLSAAELLLSDVFPKTRTAKYTYDYGDDWELKIKLLETLDDYDSSEPTCVDGFGDAPPDDVGGEYGFIDFLEAIGDKKHPEHDEMVEWGESQEFFKYSLKTVNMKLEAWRSHRMYWDERLSQTS